MKKKCFRYPPPNLIETRAYIFLFISQEDEGVLEANSVDISNASITQMTGMTMYSFTRVSVPTGEDKFALSTEEGTETNIIWAQGLDNTLGYHGSTTRGSFPVDLFCPTAASGASGVTPAPMIESTMATASPTTSTDRGLTTAPTPSPTTDSDSEEDNNGAGRVGGSGGVAFAASVAFAVGLATLAVV